MLSLTGASYGKMDFSDGYYLATQKQATTMHHLNGLMQKICNSIVNPLELIM